jgi:hypothetical protein
MLFEQRRARKRKQQRRRERLTPIMPLRESRIRLTRYRRMLLSQLVLQRRERRAVRGSGGGGEAVLYVLQLLHAAELVSHVESELAEFLLFYQRAVFALSFSSGRPHALAARKLGGGELGGGLDEGLRGRRKG